MCGTHMNILFNIEVKIIILIKWSYAFHAPPSPPPNYIDFWD
jgi:hypothetical protein